MWEGSLCQEDPLERAWRPTPVLLPGEPCEQGSLAGYTSWDRKELGMTEETLHTHMNIEYLFLYIFFDFFYQYFVMSCF